MSSKAKLFQRLPTFGIGAGHYDFDEDLFTAWLRDWSRFESAFYLLTWNADDLFHGRHGCWWLETG